MKNYLILPAALLVLVACNTETVESYPIPEAVTAYVLESTFNT